MTETVYTMRGGRQLDRANVEKARADAAVAQAEAAAHIARIQRETAQHEQAARAEQANAAREARADRFIRVRGMLLTRRDVVMVTLIMAASVGTAWPAQMAFYLGLGMRPALAVLVTAMSEGAAWAGAAMASKAIEDGRSAGLYRAITWGSALAAGGLNVAHNVHRSFPLAAVLGMASMLGVVLWESYAHSRTEHTAGRSAEEIRAELYRRMRFRRVSHRMRDLVAAVPGLTADAAWVIAWRSVHGADPGVTRRTLKRHHKAVKRIGELLDSVPEFTASPVSLSAVQNPTATLEDIAPGGSVVDSEQAIREAVVLAFESARPVAALLGTARPTPAVDVNSTAEQSTPDQGISQQNAMPHTARRSTTGTVPPSARSTVRARSDDELLTRARELAADWSDDALTAEAIRRGVRTSAKNARRLRDVLRAERTTGATPELHLVVDESAASTS